MRERVCWQHPEILARGIDQTRLAIDDRGSAETEFTFSAIGDSGSGHKRRHNPQRRVAEQLARKSSSSRFVLHTGDVIYLVGSSEQYLENFIKPYQFLLAGDRTPEQIPYDSMVFGRPFLPVLGNHDYYDLPFLYGAIAQATWPLRWLLRFPKLDVGWHGSRQGDAYARAFLDYLKSCGSPAQLSKHLDRHYTAKTFGQRCLRYQPGEFTRIPNRYYSFHYGGIDFIALDSSTFNNPPSLPNSPEGDSQRRDLERQRQIIQHQQQKLFEAITQLDRTLPEDNGDIDDMDDIYTQLEQLEEQELDIEKQLSRTSSATVDIDQLEWLEQTLIQSWQQPGSRSRVLFFHHPPYVTEATKWHQAQTTVVRQRLRTVLDAVARATAAIRRERPVIDLVLNGHAHCFEYLRTSDTGHADSHIPWVVCGGSGFSLRRQRHEGSVLTEPDLKGNNREIARSYQFLGRSGRGSDKRKAYSFLNIAVKSGEPPSFEIRPQVVERYHHQWHHYELDPIDTKQHTSPSQIAE
ncbi:metallophosphoesterase [Synechococcus sp. PCC 7336]|uniref:metallophosphoesterase family protein n=1 Tax=Synechococcus sp. PCC 7336 TaxID=195250 RepID=UPI00034BDD21|nr:metallophosphoesterase [Synechococcus sp. PCC 7336]